MKYLHVINLDKYHPGYADRTLIWCKIYFTVVTGDAEFELLHEVDQWRFVKLIILELQNKGYVPFDSKYLRSKGFNPRVRPINNTINSLVKFIEIRNGDGNLVCNGICNGKSSEVSPNPDISISISTPKVSNTPKTAIPTIEEVKAYCRERKNNIDPDKWYNFYQAKGWMIGKNSIKDWKAAVRTWENKSKVADNPKYVVPSVEEQEEVRKLISETVRSMK
jgi:hypothetical protein